MKTTNQLTPPKQISDFAKEYKNTYIALGQYKTFYALKCKEVESLKIQLQEQALLIKELNQQFIK